jgi:ribulose-5-phosphate 4-epimerase/fuculose-1-phosphate aldolase
MDEVEGEAEVEGRRRIVQLGRSLYERGLASGTSGNLSVRLPAGDGGGAGEGGGFLLTPTNVSLGWLDAGRLSRLDAEGRHIGGDPPTKEVPLHLALYAQRPDAGAVAHLHCTHAVAVSCLEPADPADVLPPLTAYYVMRVGRLPLVPYHPPGDVALADAVAEHAARGPAALLANHGPVVAGSDLDSAVAAIEELEETARLFLLLRGETGTRPLTLEQVAGLRRASGP